MKRSLERGLAALFLTASALFGKEVTYKVEGVEYEGYFLSPGPSAPLVYLVHDWDGIGEYEKKRASMLHDLGYAVFAVDLFGKGVRPESVEKRKELTSALYGDRKKMRQLLFAGWERAGALGANTDNAVGVGYCFGGAAILEMARAGAKLKAFAPFHGGLATPQGQDYGQIQGAVYVFHGTADTAITLAEFAQLGVELEAAGVPHEMTTYGGAPHAFTVFGSDRYHEEADKNSWTRFTQMLKERLR